MAKLLKHVSAPLLVRLAKLLKRVSAQLLLRLFREGGGGGGGSEGRFSHVFYSEKCKFIPFVRVIFNAYLLTLCPYSGQ